MKKTIKIEVPKGATPKMVPIGDDGWAVEFEDTKPEIEIGSWWIAPELDSHTGPFKVVNITGAAASVEYYNGDRTTYSMPSVYFLPIPTKPDEDELKKQGYELTGEARVPLSGDSWRGYGDVGTYDHSHGNPRLEMYDGRRWIVRKIALKGLDLLKTLIPGDYVAINGVGVLASMRDARIRLIPTNNAIWCLELCACVRVYDFESAIGMKIDDITESHIEWRWKAPR